MMISPNKVRWTSYHVPKTKDLKHIMYDIQLDQKIRVNSHKYDAISKLYVIKKTQ